jgi:hypothetical protein
MSVMRARARTRTPRWESGTGERHGPRFRTTLKSGTGTGERPPSPANFKLKSGTVPGTVPESPTRPAGGCHCHSVAVVFCAICLAPINANGLQARQAASDLNGGRGPRLGPPFKFLTKFTGKSKARGLGLPRTPRRRCDSGSLAHGGTTLALACQCTVALALALAPGTGAPSRYGVRVRSAVAASSPASDSHVGSAPCSPR